MVEETTAIPIGDGLYVELWDGTTPTTNSFMDVIRNWKKELYVPARSKKKWLEVWRKNQVIKQWNQRYWRKEGHNQKNMIVKGSQIELILKNLIGRNRHNSKENSGRSSPLLLMGRRRRMWRTGYWIWPSTFMFMIMKEIWKQDYLFINYKKKFPYGGKRRRVYNRWRKK